MEMVANFSWKFVLVKVSYGLRYNWLGCRNTLPQFISIIIIINHLEKT